MTDQVALASDTGSLAVEARASFNPRSAMIVPMAPTARAARVFGATNARAHDAAPLPLWNAHHTGANLALRRNGSFTSTLPSGSRK